MNIYPPFRLQKYQHLSPPKYLLVNTIHIVRLLLSPPAETAVHIEQEESPIITPKISDPKAYQTGRVDKACGNWMRRGGGWCSEAALKAKL